jgi:hypothetical protein
MCKLFQGSRFYFGRQRLAILCHVEYHRVVPWDSCYSFIFIKDLCAIINYSTFVLFADHNEKMSLFRELTTDIIPTRSLHVDTGWILKGYEAMDDLHFIKLKNLYKITVRKEHHMYPVTFLLNF